VRGLDVDGRFWSEVDYIEDYQRILDHLGVNADAHELLLSKSF
jgi:choline kinase